MSIQLGDSGLFETDMVGNLSLLKKGFCYTYLWAFWFEFECEDETLPNLQLQHKTFVKKSTSGNG